MFGGRWNQRGTPVVYTSETLSLAALEYLVHVDPGDAPPDLVATSAEIPNSVPIARIRVRDLPRDWRAYPAPPALAELGAEWIAAAANAVLAVPSTLIPTEWNYLLNPSHPGYAAVRVAQPVPFSFDPRLLRPGRR